MIKKVKKKFLKLIAKQLPGNGLRIRLLRMCGYKIGDDVYIGEDFIIIDDLGDELFNLSIGDRVAVSPRVTFVLHTQPNDSRIAPYVRMGDFPLIIFVRRLTRPVAGSTACMPYPPCSLTVLLLRMLSVWGISWMPTGRK